MLLAVMLAIAATVPGAQAAVSGASSSGTLMQNVESTLTLTVSDFTKADGNTAAAVMSVRIIASNGDCNAADSLAGGQPTDAVRVNDTEATVAFTITADPADGNKVCWDVAAAAENVVANYEALTGSSATNVTVVPNVNLVVSAVAADSSSLTIGEDANITLTTVAFASNTALSVRVVGASANCDSAITAEQILPPTDVTRESNTSGSIVWTAAQTNGIAAGSYKACFARYPANATDASANFVAFGTPTITVVEKPSTGAAFAAPVSVLLMVASMAFVLLAQF